VITVYRTRRMDKLIEREFLGEARMKQVAQFMKVCYTTPKQMYSTFTSWMELWRRPLRQETVILELDEKERIMGIEIWDASKRGVWRSS